MKKTGIYILSILVIVVLSASFIVPIMRTAKMTVESFMLGFKAGYNDEKVIELGEPISIKFTPDTRKLISTNDSIRFDDGKTLPVVMDTATLMVPERQVPAWHMPLIGIIGISEFALLVTAIVFFIKFIMNISKEKIFVHENVKYLRVLSIAILVTAVLEFAAVIVADCTVSSLNINSSGYSISSDWVFPWDNLLIGFIGLLMAAVWDRGIKIQQDQELTI